MYDMSPCSIDEKGGDQREKIFFIIIIIRTESFSHGFYFNRD